jgi:magnesium transporter
VIQVIRQGNGHEAGVAIPIDQLSEVIARHDAAVWVNVVDATPEEIARVGEEFGLHPLALEDTVRGGQRPKFEQYDGYRFIVFYGLSTAADSRPQTHEVDIFVGEHVMVTFHRGQLRVIAETAERWRANVATMGNRGVGFLLYSLLDALVDGYFPVLDVVAERTEGLEETVFVRGQRGFQAEILQLRRDLLMIRRVAGPERDVLNELVRRDPPLFSQHEVVYFQDVYDHLLRITDTVDLYRDMLSSVLDANLSIISYNLNEVVKRLTSSSIILMSMGLIAGIYGMNFVYMPELRWPWGYPFALLLMAAVAAIEVAVFRRIGWL